MNLKTIMQRAYEPDAREVTDTEHWLARGYLCGLIYRMKPYLIHDDDCAISRPANICSCGLDEILDELDFSKGDEG